MVQILRKRITFMLFFFFNQSPYLVIIIIIKLQDPDLVITRKIQVNSGHFLFYFFVLLTSPLVPGLYFLPLCFPHPVIVHLVQSSLPLVFLVCVLPYLVSS